MRILPLWSRRDRGRDSRRPLAVRTLFVCLLIGLAAADNKKETSCPPPGDCGPFGTCIPCDAFDVCVGARCKCEPDYAGNDCSLRVEFCPESVDPADSASTCLNGGRCVAKEIVGTNGPMDVWRCDCTTATGAAAAFAGTQCEFPATTSCLTGGATSDYSFCVNGGECFRRIAQGEDHPGCTGCSGFEGRHCQYAEGTAPPEELEAARQDAVEGSDDVPRGLIIILSLLGSLLIGWIGLLLWRQHTTLSKEAAELDAPDDLQLRERTTSPRNEDDERPGLSEDDDDVSSERSKPQIV
jgi:hypothetical protein